MDAFDITRGQFALLALAALASTAYGGLRAGVITSLLGMLLIDVMVLEPRWRLNAARHDSIALGVMTAATLIAGALYESAQRSRRRAEALTAELDASTADLKAREHHWRQLVDATPGMILETGNDGGLIFAGRSWQEFAGRDAAGLAGLESLLHEDDAAGFRAAREEARRSGSTFTHQCRLRARAGAHRWQVVFGTPIRDERGDVASWAYAAIDIDEIKRGEQRLRNQAELLERTHDAIMVWDFDHSAVRYWNRAAEELYGYAAEEAHGRSPHELLRARHDEPLEAIEQALVRAGTWDGGLWHTTRDGRELRIESRRVLVAQADGSRSVLETNRDVTDRERAAEALRESESRWRQLTDAMPGIVCEAAKDGRLLFFNDHALVYAGRPQEDLLGDGWLEIVHPEDREPAAANWAAALERGEAVTYEQRLRRADGTYRWHLGYGVPLRDAAGAVTSWLGVNIDIHDRKLAEETLRANEEINRTRMEALPAIAWQLDEGGNVVYVNDGWRQYSGLPLDAAHRAGWRQIVHLDDLEAYEARRAAAIAAGQMFEGEVRLRNADGEYRWHAVRIAPFPRSGTPLGWFGAAVDIDARRRAEEALLAGEERLRQSVARYEALIAAAPSFVFSADARGVLDWNSPGYFEYIGAGEDEAWRWQERDVVHPEDAATLRTRWDEAIAQQQPFELEMRLRGADGAYRWHLTRVAPMLDSGGAVQGWIGTSTNIDERRRAEEALRGSEQRTRAIVDTAVDAIITIGEDGKIQSWNPAAQRIFGYTAGEVLGENVRMLMPSPDYERHDGYIRRYLETGERRIIGIGREVTGRRKDGSLFPMDLAISDVVIDGAHIFTGIVRDISERKAQEAALRESEERFRLAASVSRLGAWEWDLGTSMIWSQGMEEIYGFAAGAFPGTFQAFMDRVHPDDRDATMRAITNALAAGTDLDIEHRALTGDAAPCWINLRGRVLRDDGGSVRRMAGIGIDITERKQTLLEVAVAEERLRLATQGAEFGTWDWDSVSDAVYMSERECELFGLMPGATFTSDTLMERVHEDDRAMVSAILRDAIERRGSCELEFRVAHPDGSVRWLAGWVMVAPDLQQSGARLIGLNADITERKRQEREKQVLADLGDALQRTLDYGALLANITRALVGTLARYCALYVREGEQVRRVASGAGADQVDVSAAAERGKVSAPVRRALEDGAETLVPHIDDAMLRRAASSREQLEMFRAVQLASSIVVPLRSAGGVIGALSLAASADQPAFDATDLDLAREVARRITLAIENAWLYAETETARVRANALAELSSILAGSLDYEATLRRAAEAIVPVLSDWCAIQLLSDDGGMQRVAITHSDPAKLVLVEELERRWPPEPDPDAEHGFWRVVRTRESELLEEIPTELLEQAARDEEHMEQIRQLGLRSGLVVPLVARERVLGAITLVMAESGRRFAAADVPMYEELARRAAVAIDNARLYRAEQEAQAQLAQRLEELRAALAAKDDFLGMVSHELKTPITMVLGNAEILLRRADALDADTRQESLADIHHDAERLHSIIENLLLLARLEHGTELPFEPVFVSRLVERLAGEHQRRHRQRTVRVREEAESAVAIGEPTYIEQTLRNLLSNAEKYSPARAPIDVVIGEDEASVIVRVIDRGPGVGEHEVEEIFKPFYRSASTAQAVHGVGVGLAVCKRLVEVQGGSIWCRRLDEGTEIGFALPKASE